MPEAKSFFDDLKDEEGAEEEDKKVAPVAEETTEVKPIEPKEKSSMEVSLERKSTALAEERRKRKDLEARLKVLEGKKTEDVDEEEDEVEIKDKKETKQSQTQPLDEEALLVKLEQRRKTEQYSNGVDEEIHKIAKGIGQSKQWATKLRTTVDSLPPNVKSGNPAEDTKIAIRFLASSSGEGSFNMPSSSSFDLASSSSNYGDSELSANGRELATALLNVDDKEIDKYMKTPRTRLENGNVSFKLIK